MKLQIAPCLVLLVVFSGSFHTVRAATAIQASNTTVVSSPPVTQAASASQSTQPTSPAPTTQAAPQAQAPPPPTTPAVSNPIRLTGRYLTTKSQSNGPTIIVDQTGEEVTLHGLGWYGFNLGGSAPLDLTKGLNAISQDLDQIVYRMKMLGFNAVRLPMTFDRVWGLGQAPLNLTRKCVVPSVNDIERTLIPPRLPQLPLAQNTKELPQAPPDVEGGICNADMPDDTTVNRYLWVIQRFVEQGFYVNVDYHSNLFTDEVAHGDGSIYNQDTWISTWVQLLEAILQSVPAAAGRLLIDLVNEPDGFSLKWTSNNKLPSLTDIYINTIDALYPVCPGCIYLVEGTGQANYCGVNWGNGFATSQTVINKYKISDATPFFNGIMSKPWLSQLVLAPHFYCPGVSGADACYAGATQWMAYDDTVGYLTRSPGYCKGGTCKVFPALVDEFGSTINTTIETSCMQSIISYMNVGNTGKHAPLTSWFYWAWQPDSNGTGGMVDDDWMTIRWDKVDSLSGGTTDWPQGLGLSPWYLATYNKTAPTFYETEATNPFLSSTASKRAPGPMLPAAATPANAPTVAQWVAATQLSSKNGAPAAIAAIGSIMAAALLLCIVLVLV